jgi:hypothetical protein
MIKKANNIVDNHFYSQITKINIGMVRGYEARTPLGGGVSRCPTRVGVRHLYDTRTTPVGIVKQVSQKK